MKQIIILRIIFKYGRKATVPENREYPMFLVSVLRKALAFPAKWVVLKTRVEVE